MVDSLSVGERELLDAIAQAQIAENAAAARKPSAIREFALLRAATLTSVGDVEPERVERKIVAEVAVACRVSPFQGRRRLHLARDLHLGLDHVRGLFAAGELAEATVLQVVAATDHLDPGERAAVDQRLAGEGIQRLGVRRVHDLVTGLAMEIAPEKAKLKARAARAGRHVRIRLAADGMADLVAHLPAEQAAACLGALHRAVHEHYVTAETVTRSRGQILADTLVERLTGQTTAGDVNVEVQILVPVESLLDPTSPLPAQIAGHGPIPADIAREMLHTGKKTLRRLVTRDGIVIGGDSRRRAFDGVLETFIRARDGNRCTEPYCDAPIRHIDHKERWADGGRTEFVNGRGLCEFHNHAREPVCVERRVHKKPHSVHSRRGIDTGPGRGRTCARGRSPVPKRPARAARERDRLGAPCLTSTQWPRLPAPWAVADVLTVVAGSPEATASRARREYVRLPERLPALRGGGHDPGTRPVRLRPPDLPGRTRPTAPMSCAAGRLYGEGMCCCAAMTTRPPLSGGTAVAVTAASLPAPAGGSARTYRRISVLPAVTRIFLCCRVVLPDQGSHVSVAAFRFTTAIPARPQPDPPSRRTRVPPPCS